MPKRTKLAEGCWGDPYGTAVIVTVRGKTHEERHPRGTPVADLILYRTHLRARMEHEVVASPPPSKIATPPATVAYDDLVLWGRLTDDERALLREMAYRYLKIRGQRVRHG